MSVVDRVRLVSGRLRNKLYNIRRTLIKIGLVEKQCLQRELEIDADLGKYFFFETFALVGVFSSMINVY